MSDPAEFSMYVAHRYSHRSANRLRDIHMRIQNAAERALHRIPMRPSECCCYLRSSV